MHGFAVCDQANETRGLKIKKEFGQLFVGFPFYLEAQNRPTPIESIQIVAHCFWIVRFHMPIASKAIENRMIGE